MTVSTQRSPGSAPAPDRWEVHAAAGHLADAVVEFVRERDWVTPVEIQQRFAAYFPVHGTFDWASGTHRNVIFWVGLSEELADAIIDLLRAERRFMHPASMLTYFADGAFLMLPLVKCVPPGGYKRQHWAPTALRVVPMDNGRTKRTRR
jgi:hypothetical protein